ncbi:hypothetical protein HYW20_02925 [Candidatus Woesearchaeota archaeon]|nr:hypothetical protein [Candidatus Woesearchaeota archaeon]
MPEKEKSAEQKETEAKNSEQNTKKILELSEISIWIDTYDDIFSDFDPRPYSQRSLSDDFLTESRKASMDKAGKLELRLLVSEEKRDAKNESVIKKRLHEHFTKHAQMLKKEIKSTRNKSVIAAFIGILMLLSATYIGSFESSAFIMRFLFVLLEPAGWFTTWFALDRLFYTTEKKKEEHNFYEKMSKCEIMFSSY